MTTTRIGTPLADAAATNPADRPAALTQQQIDAFPARWPRIRVEVSDDPNYWTYHLDGLHRFRPTTWQLPAIHISPQGRIVVLLPPEQP